MRRVGRISLYAVVVLVVIVGGGVGFLFAMSPDQRPAPTRSVERTPARIERGRYLAEHLLDCTAGCHSKRDFSRFGGPVISDVLGEGAPCLSDLVPGTVCFPNITPDREHGIGAWTDGEIMRVIREGVNRDGRAIFLMPFVDYAAMSDEDTKSVVAYLRTLRPSAASDQPSAIGFPLNIFMKFDPTPLEGPVPEPDHTNPVAYGRYLATIAGCIGCHTPVDDHHKPLPGMDLAGGQEFVGPWGTVRSTNLTPHSTSNLPSMNREEFIARFKVYADPAAVVPVPEGQNTPMAWLAYAGLTEDDLGAIYAYLKTVRPIDNEVVIRP